MKTNSQGFLAFAVEVFSLARGYGRRRLIGAFAMILLQGVFQVVGVTSIFPFLAIASDPKGFRESSFGKVALDCLPPLSDKELLLLAGSGSILMLLLSNAIALLGDVNRARFSNGVGYHLRMQILRRISERPYGYFLERNTAVLIQKLQTDVLLFVNNILGPILELGSSALSVILLLTTIMLVDPWIPIGAAVLIGGFYWAVGAWLRPKSRLLGERLKQSNRGSSKALQQYLQGIKTVFVHNCTGHFFGNYETFVSDQRQILPKIQLYGGCPRYLIEPLAFGGLVTVVLVFAMRGEGLEEILPSLGVLALAAYRLLPEAQKAYGKVNNLTTYRYVVPEIRAEIGRDGEAAKGVPKNQISVSFERFILLDRVTFKYPQAQRPVLQSVSLEIHKNQSLGIVGPTGSGKSTLVDLLLGLHWPQSGRIVVDGRELQPQDMPQWRSLIGYVPQDIYLLDDSIAANIAFGVPKDRVDRLALERAADAAQIRTFIERELPQHWDTVVGERGVRLSGGQRQRIGLARALYHQPSILILDEATSALDHQTESLVLEAIERLRGAMTMVVIAHRLHTIERCDRIHRMDVGTAT